MYHVPPKESGRLPSTQEALALASAKRAASMRGSGTGSGAGSRRGLQLRGLRVRTGESTGSGAAEGYFLGMSGLGKTPLLLEGRKPVKDPTSL